MFKVQRSLITNSRKIPNKEKRTRISLSSQKKGSKLTILQDAAHLYFDAWNQKSLVQSKLHVCVFTNVPYYKSHN